VWRKYDKGRGIKPEGRYKRRWGLTSLTEKKPKGILAGTEGGGNPGKSVLEWDEYLERASKADQKKYLDGKRRPGGEIGTY